MTSDELDLRLIHPATAMAQYVTGLRRRIDDAIFDTMEFDASSKEILRCCKGVRDAAETLKDLAERFPGRAA